MITARRTRLLRAPDLAAFRHTITTIVGSLTPDLARDTFIVVPTRAAGEQLRRTAEDRLLSASARAIALPRMGTRGDLYEELASRLAAAPPILSAFDREVLLAAVARALQDEGLTPPFQLRPGLIAEMLALYDQIRRLGRTVDDFDRNFTQELEKDQDTDRGAAKLLQQTQFLAAIFRGYEHRVAAQAAVDEHLLRARLIEESASQPQRRIVLTVLDRTADPDGLWPADYDLLTRLPHLESLEIVATESVLAAGVLERLYGVLPELEDEKCGTAAALPLFLHPRQVNATDPPCFTYRDREDELSAIARRVKAAARDGSLPRLHRAALVVRRPLPYLYLARDVLTGGGIPFETQDTLPLAAEPYAAAVDVVLDAVSADFTRGALLALLRSPHFLWSAGAQVSPTALTSLDFALAESRYLGGLDRLSQLAERWSAIEAPSSREERKQQAAAPAARLAVQAARALAPLANTAPVIDQIDTLRGFLRDFHRPPEAADSTAARTARVRAAVLGALTALRDAYAHHDQSATTDVAALSASIRRWLGAQTFAMNTGEPGLQIVDAQAARYGDFDDVQLVGLVDGEWPERARRNVLYPASLLSLLEPLPAVADPARRERDALNAARAAFRDLLGLARERVRVSTFVLENDAVVEPSILVDELDALPLPRQIEEEGNTRIFQTEALALEPRRPESLPLPAAAWAAARLRPADDARFHGEAGAWTLPRVSVSRLERYQDCPFRFFASEVLRLEEQPEDEDGRTPLERGRFLHELFERFFAAWQKAGHGRIEPERLHDARALFVTICEEALSGLSPAEAALERARLLGTAVNPGIAHRVFAMEAERPARILERLLEFPLQGDFVFRSAAGVERRVPLSAKADRIDVLADSSLRVIDYKSKTTPEVKRALQLPVYSQCARVTLERDRGTKFSLSEAMYVSFEGEKAVVPLRARDQTLEQLVEAAQARVLKALDDIAAGHFPPQPSKKSICRPCAYSTVCRLEYVEAAPEREDGDLPAAHE